MSDPVQMQWLREQVDRIKDKFGDQVTFEDWDWQLVREFFVSVRESDQFDRAVDLVWSIEPIEATDLMSEDRPKLRLTCSVSDEYLEELLTDYEKELQGEEFLVEILPRQIDQLMLSVEYFQAGFRAAYVDEEEE